MENINLLLIFLLSFFLFFLCYFLSDSRLWSYAAFGVMQTLKPELKWRVQPPSCDCTLRQIRFTWGLLWCFNRSGTKWVLRELKSATGLVNTFFAIWIRGVELLCGGQVKAGRRWLLSAVWEQTWTEFCCSSIYSLTHWASVESLSKLACDSSLTESLAPLEVTKPINFNLYLLEKACLNLYIGFLLQYSRLNKAQ